VGLIKGKKGEGKSLIPRGLKKVPYRMGNWKPGLPILLIVGGRGLRCS